jgi:hypothetical protein
MSHQYLNQENINIDVYPQLDAEHQLANGKQLSLGDLHGNFQKLLYAGVRHGALQIAPEDFSHLTAIYAKKPLQAVDIKQFKEILARVVVNPSAKDSLLRLIGDVMADRGASDYLTLKLKQKFKQGGLPVENLLSNHDAEFIELYEQNLPFNSSKLGAQANSANQLQDLIDRNVVSRDEINALIEECYKPTLKALSYSFNEEGKLTIYSHAAIGIQNIQYMAEELNLPWLGNDDPSIAKTIDAINVEFAKHVQNNTVTKLIGLDKVPVSAINGKEQIDAKKFPFAFLIWNRSAKGLMRPDHIDFVHGHDKSDLTKGNIFNLDNDLGKAPGRFHTGIYNVLYSKVKGSAPALVMPKIIEEYRPIATIDNIKPEPEVKKADELIEKEWELIEATAPVIAPSYGSMLWQPLKSLAGAASGLWWGSNAKTQEPVISSNQKAVFPGLTLYSKRGEKLDGPADLTQSVIGLPEGTTFDSYQNSKKITVY